MIENVLLLDTETGGLDPTKDPLVEIACIRWSVPHACVLSTWSTLVQAEANAAESVNKIPAAALPSASPKPSVFGLLHQLAEKSDIIIAHNASFDRGFLPDLGKPWVCSMEDIAWPGAKPGGFSSVIDLALANDIAVAQAHRALADCQLLARLLERMVEKKMDLQAMFAHAMRPKAEFLAMASFEQKDIVKAHGFKWFPDQKQWRRRMAIEDVAALPFKVRQLGAT